MKSMKYIKVKLFCLKYRWVARLPEIKLFLPSMAFSCCIQRLCLFSSYLTSQQHLCQSISLSSWIHFLHLAPRAHSGFPPVSLCLLISLLFLHVHAVHGVLKARILKWFAIPSPVDHVLSELSTMTPLSWVALHSMVHSCIELDKAVVHVIS